MLSETRRFRKRPAYSVGEKNTRLLSTDFLTVDGWVAGEFFGTSFYSTASLLYCWKKKKVLLQLIYLFVVLLVVTGTGFRVRTEPWPEAVNAQSKPGADRNHLHPWLFLQWWQEMEEPLGYLLTLPLLTLRSKPVFLFPTAVAPPSCPCTQEFKYGCFFLGKPERLQPRFY